MGSFDGGEIERHGFPRLGVLDFFVDSVAFVLRFALDVALCGPLLAALHFDCEVNMPRPSGIKHRLDRAKIILTGRAGQEAAKPLEVFVTRRMSVTTVQIVRCYHLPDLDQCIPDRLTLSIKNASA